MNMRGTAVVPGSLGAVAAADHRAVAESFLDADTIVLVDVSGSMSACDSRGGRKRYEVACEELARLQATLPGKLAVVAFSSRVEFVPGGVPPFLSGGTDLAAALRFVSMADGCVTFVVISDGQPDNEEQALAVAATFSSRVDVVHVGPESDRRGAEFLAMLARAAGGRFATADRAADLAEKVEALRLGNGRR